MRETRVERRRERRLLCADLVTLRAQVGGVPRAIVVNLEDISPSGARVQTDEAIPAGNPVELHCGDRTYAGLVRYSRSSALGHDLGIQFAPVETWRASDFKPEHLFDPASLKASKRPRRIPPDRSKPLPQYE